MSSTLPELQFTYETPNVGSTVIPQYIIRNKYIITEKLGKGKFGEVYKGKDTQTNEIVAVKLEHHIMPKPNPYSKYYTKHNEFAVLKHETQILNYLHNRRCCNIPYIYWYGIQSGIPSLVMPYYEFSLFDLFTQTAHKHTKYRYSSQTADWKPNDIIRSIIRIVENVHALGVVHRDIKPHNFMVKNRELVLIDFGMATFYVDEHNQHIPEPEKQKEHLLGTQKYISINIHYGKEYTRRDDLISAGYLYLFLRNWLFWDRVVYIPSDMVYPNTTLINDQNTYKTHNVVSSRIHQYPDTHICHPKNVCFKMSKEFSNIEKCILDVTDKTHDNVNSTLEYLRYSYALGFNETPNYQLLSRLFSVT